MKIFIAGPRAVTILDEEAKSRINNIIDNNYEILLGDAIGVDKLVQSYLSERKYPLVSIYASNGKARNNVGGWPIKKVEVAGSVKGFEFYAMKDKQMALEADYGFMIWDGKSKGTLNNIINLLRQDTTVLVYLTTNKEFVVVEDYISLEVLVNRLDQKTKKLFYKLSDSPDFAKQESDQLSLEAMYN